MSTSQDTCNGLLQDRVGDLSLWHTIAVLETIPATKLAPCDSCLVLPEMVSLAWTLPLHTMCVCGGGVHCVTGLNSPCPP